MNSTPGLRNLGRHLPRRNTRYRAGATPFPDRTFTGWTAPASPGAPLRLHCEGLSPSTPCRSPGAHWPRFAFTSHVTIIDSGAPTGRGVVWTFLLHEVDRKRNPFDKLDRIYPISRMNRALESRLEHQSHRNQFSMRRSSIRENSRALSVTIV